MGNPSGISSLDVYAKDVTTDEYVEVSFNDADGNKQFAHSIMIVNDGPQDLLISWDGSTLGGEIYSKEWVTFDRKFRDCVYVKHLVANVAYRIWAW